MLKGFYFSQISNEFDPNEAYMDFLKQYKTILENVFALKTTKYC